MYLREGKGSRVVDVDGNEYLDFHNGFGCMIVGHAHPKVAEAITRAAHTGTHVAAPTEATVQFAEIICERFGADSIRFANSGTEATMGAIRVARAATGREHIVKVEGSYHGHHDSVMFSVVPGSDLIGGRDAPSTTPMSTGIPAVMSVSRPWVCGGSIPASGMDVTPSVTLIPDAVRKGDTGQSGPTG